MRDRDWDSVLWGLEHRACILLLGPDLSDDCSASAVPLSAELSSILREDLREPPAARDIPAVAQRYASEHSPLDLRLEVVRFYQSHDSDASEVHDKLATLPFNFIVMSCHDNLFEAALKRQNKQPKVARYHFRSTNNELVPIGSVAAPLIYHLYGSIDEPNSLVLTENDLLDFLVAVITKNPPLPNTISAELQAPGKSLLFIGFGIRHWYLRILLHVLRQVRPESRSFALETARAAIGDIEQTVFFYKEPYRIEVFQSEIHAFVQELYERAARRGLLEVTNDPPAADFVPPKVFISHASEDRPFALKLYSTMNDNGLEPWFDQEKLEPGDAWNPLIEDRIRSSDYFLVVQSEALHRKKVSYVNKEINIALDRQKEFRRGAKFITPIQIDGSLPLDELKEYQSLLVHTDEDLSKMISILKRDFQLRRRI